MIRSTDYSKIEDPFRRPRGHRDRASSRCRNVQTQKIPVTLAERPHPFPSRTRKLSSPAPKILRGQPFGKIGRRRDFCVSARLFVARVDVTRHDGTALSASRGPVPAILFVHDRRPSPNRSIRRFPSAVEHGRSRAAHVPVPVRLVRRWRLARRDRDRDHRCGAVTPPAPVATEKQRRLCLTPNTRPARPSWPPLRLRPEHFPVVPRRLPRPLARTTPVVLDHIDSGSPCRPSVANRSTGQAALVACSRSRSLRSSWSRGPAVGGGVVVAAGLAVGAADRELRSAERRQPDPAPTDRSDRGDAGRHAAVGPARHRRPASAPARRHKSARQPSRRFNDEAFEQPLARSHRGGLMRPQGAPDARATRVESDHAPALCARSALAASAVRSDEPAGPHLGDPRAAARARLSALVVDGEEVADLQLERRRHALRAARRSRLPAWSASPRRARRPPRPPGSSACGTAAVRGVQDLVAVGVADPGHERLVAEQVLELARMPPDPLAPDIERQRGIVGVGTLLRPHRGRVRVGRRPAGWR